MALAVWVAPLGAQQPGALPLPKGYQPRTPAPARAAAPPTGATPGGPGTVMYFSKPAEARTATGANGQPVRPAGAADGPLRSAEAPVPDVPALPPPLPASRYLSEGKAAPHPAFAQPEPGTGAAQPLDAPSTSKKAIPPVPPEAIQLPARQNVFTVYNDDKLEKAIMERVREDLRRDNKYTPQQEQYLVLPPLPVVSPPGVAYRPKTSEYEPRQVLIEPHYVTHRRLHFEERNSERNGWDLGPLQTLVSTAYFWRDTLLWPQSLASACVRGPWDTSAGKSTPGCPTPYYVYPLGLTVTGTAAETAIITGGAFLLP